MKGRAKGMNQRRALIKAYGSLGQLSLLQPGSKSVMELLRNSSGQPANDDKSSDDHHEPKTKLKG